MSSFLVDDSCINGILSYASRLAGRDDMSSRYARTFFKTCGINWLEGDMLSILGKSMLTMNREALTARYGDEIEPFAYAFEPTRTDVFQALKSLDCFLYQCSEGDVPSKDLYKACEAFADGLRRMIVNDLPGYEKATWG